MNSDVYDGDNILKYFKSCDFLAFKYSRRRSSLLFDSLVYFAFRVSISRYSCDKYTVNYSGNSRFPKDFVSKYDTTDVIRLCDISVLIASPLARHERQLVMRISIRILFFILSLLARANP